MEKAIPVHTVEPGCQESFLNLVEPLEDRTFPLLRTLSLAILCADTEDQLFKALLDASLELTGASAGFVAVADSNRPGRSRQWSLARTAGSLGPLQGNTLVKAAGFIGTAIRCASTVVVGPRGQWLAPLNHPILCRVAEAALVPVKEDGSVHAVVGLLGMEGDPPLDLKSLNLLEHLADLAAVAGRNVRTRVQLEVELQEKRKDHALRREIEKRLSRAEKMEAVGRMAQCMVHDFNNILALIELNTTKALETADSAQPDSALYLKRILVGCEKAKTIVEQVYQLRQDRQDVMQPLCLGSVVREIIELFRSKMPDAVQLQTRFSPVDYEVKGNRTQLERVVVNLLKNALEAMDPYGGLLMVEMQRLLMSPKDVLRFPGLHAGPHVRLRIADSGPGIPPDVRDRLFEPFFTTKGSKGTGLGLYAVYEILKAHQGYIDVQSSPGSGAVFDVYLPASRQDPPGAPPMNESIQTDGPGLLLIEDDPLFSETLSSLLEQSGWVVFKAADGRQALSLAISVGDSLRAVITDYQLPGEHGIAVARRLRLQGIRAPILLLSGLPDEAVKYAVENGSIQRMLIKPVSFEELLQALQQCTT